MAINPTDPTIDQLRNRTLAVDGTSSALGTVAGADVGQSDSGVGAVNDSASQEIGDYLNENPISSQESSIMDSYNKAAAEVPASVAGANAGTNEEYNPQISQQQLENTNAINAQAQSQRGFAVNTAAVNTITETGNERVRELTDQRDSLLLQNNAAGATQLESLIVNEQAAITSARQAWITNLLGVQGAQNQNTQTNLAVADNQTPAQKQIMSLQATYPDAGITADDSLASASAKIARSPSFQTSLASTKAGTAASLGSAASSEASAAQTSAITSFIGSGKITPSDPNLQALQNGTLTPAELQTNFANTPSGGYYVQSVLDAYEAAGGSIDAATQAGNARNLQTNNANSGNFLTEGTNALNESAGSLSSLIFGNGSSSDQPNDLSGALTGARPLTFTGSGGSNNTPAVGATITIQKGNSQEIPAGNYVVGANGALTPQ